MANENLNPTAAKWIADGWTPTCQDDYEWATNTGQYTPHVLGFEARARWIRRQIVDTMADIECMRADYRRIGESSGWEDARLDARYADIERFEGKVAAWRRELRQLAQDARMAPETTPAESEWDEPHPAA